MKNGSSPVCPGNNLEAEKRVVNRLGSVSGVMTGLPPRDVRGGGCQATQKAGYDEAPKWPRWGFRSDEGRPVDLKGEPAPARREKD